MNNEQIIAEYRRISVAFEGAINCVLGALKIIEHEQTSDDLHSPIHSITSRVKSPESTQKKLERHGLPFTIDNVVNQLNDIAGVRVICKYISDIYLIRDMLLASKQFAFFKEKDYIREPKPSGYRSLHLIVETDVHLSGGVRKVRCEIQLRTSAMDSWASLEHNMRYKNDLPENSRLMKVSGNALRCCITQILKCSESLISSASFRMNSIPAIKCNLDKNLKGA